MHILSNDSELCNSWTTKYSIFDNMPGYMTHYKLICDMSA